MQVQRLLKRCVEPMRSNLRNLHASWRPTEQCSVRKNWQRGFIRRPEWLERQPFAFKQWLCFADVFFTVDLDFVEEHGDVVVTFTETTEIVCYFVWNFEE
jgi:hypothetical protein